MLALKGSWRSKKRYPMEVRQRSALQFRAPLSHFLHVTFISSRRNRGSVFKFSNVFTFWHTFFVPNLEFSSVSAIWLTFLLNLRVYHAFCLLLSSVAVCGCLWLSVGVCGCLWLSVAVCGCLCCLFLSAAVRVYLCL